jgi:hypothetical protein
MTRPPKKAEPKTAPDEKAPAAQAEPGPALDPEVAPVAAAGVVAGAPAVPVGAGVEPVTAADLVGPEPEPAPSRPELAGQAVLVSGPKRGRWRAVGGRAVRFGPEPVRVAVAELSAAEAAAIRDDPALLVVPAPAVEAEG